ncbi:protein unc-13 homolog isoform X2 [Punica granatum]|nr:protein unc-13 homolog isoform X2 [Punica granatum]
MEEENATELLQRYRRDRRILLNFMLSGSLIKKVIMPPGAVSLDDVDLDQVSADYVLSCAKKGEMLELSEAIRAYHDHTGLPQMNNAGSTDEFFLVTSPEFSGSPPRRAAPPVPAFKSPPIPSFLPASAPLEPSPVPDFASSPVQSSVARSESFSSQQVQELTVDDIEDFEDDDYLDEVDSRRVSRRNISDAAELVPNLPLFATGITDDDLRETAYEILLACAGASGGLIVPTKEKKKDKRSKLIRKLGRSKTENVMAPSRTPGLVGLLETMRVQMEISEVMDIRTRQGLLNAMVGKVGKRMDSLLIPLELLCCISRTEFSDKKAYIKWQKRQLYMLEEGLINHAAVGFSESGRKASELRILMAKIEESESFPPSTGEIQRTESLRALREVAIPLAERPARGDLTGEVCHWADGYHLNVRIYEKLLLSVFDVLDEGKLTDEVEEILELLKSTWRVLGITETIHYTCYAWVLFRQYVITSELGMLQHAIEQLNRIPLKEQRGPQERSHLRSLYAKVDVGDDSRDVSFLHSFLMPIQRWADKRLGDYHLHFSEGPAMLESVLKVSMISRRLLLEEPEMMQSMSVSDRDQIESYISSSIKSAFSRVLLAVDKLEATHDHPLALLAEETKRLVQKDSSTFMPIFSKRHPKAAIVSASLLHRFYGHKLKPFLDGAEHLTEDVASVFPAADSLEQYIISLIATTCGEENIDFYTKKLSLYQIESVSGTLVLRWVNSQLERISNWVERAIQQERWDPISPQQRHGPSIVEVYRIVEETVDQFFALKVPMRLTELNSMFRGIDNAFQKYANRVVEDLASKEEVIPPEPVLTRYKKEAGIKAFVKKELFETPRLPDERRSVDVSVRTTRTLCVQLNTLYYAISQLNKLEDSIWERWTRKKPRDKFTNEKSKSMTRKDTFDGSRKDMNAAIDRICEFTGTKIVFWDLRDPFIETLYKPSVSQSRLEALIELLDTELNQLCDIITEPLRDRIVTSLLQASLDGLLRVILNGGPLRVFSPSDAKLLEEDLEVLKEFFISGGDGLPRGVVENQVARVREVIKLHGYETRELIDDLRSLSGIDINMQGRQSKLGADSNTLIRILCHRSDSEASQFLKKQYKLPKSCA